MSMGDQTTINNNKHKKGTIKTEIALNRQQEKNYIARVWPLGFQQWGLAYHWHERLHFRG